MATLEHGQAVRPVIENRGRWTVGFDPFIVLAFLFPLTRFVYIDVGGKIFGQDILAVLMMMFLFTQAGTMRRLDRLSILFVLLFAWLANQVITDIYRGSAVGDYQRVWAKIFLFGIQIMALWIFLPRRPAYIVAYALGSAIVSVAAVSQLEEAARLEAWKFGYGDALSMVVAVVFSGFIPGTQALRRFAGPALLVTAVWVLLHNARANFGILVIAGTYCMAAEAIAKSAYLQARVTKVNFALMLGAGLLVGQAATGAYGYLADAGYLGHAAQIKYHTQSSGDVSIIRGGRVESLVSTIAVADAPIIGHGSWARDMYYVRLLRVRMKELGLKQEVSGAERYNDLIPSHSFFFSAWVEAGIGGAIFWGYVAAMAFLATFWLLKRRGFLTPLAIYSILSLFWQIAFSPFGAEMRFIAAYQIVLTFWILKQEGMLDPVHFVRRNSGP